mmetsp:Transcript_11801/g.24943  ORF Transcript_11801/g.24943 Transcript_11801/m.24943 type:complete len:404 (-) Transcript_11801:66-1277(-)
MVICRIGGTFWLFSDKNPSKSNSLSSNQAVVSPNSTIGSDILSCMSFLSQYTFFRSSMDCSKWSSPRHARIRSPLAVAVTSTAASARLSWTRPFSSRYVSEGSIASTFTLTRGRISMSENPRRGIPCGLSQIVAVLYWKFSRFWMAQRWPVGTSSTNTNEDPISKKRRTGRLCIVLGSLKLCLGPITWYVLPVFSLPLSTRASPRMTVSSLSAVLLGSLMCDRSAAMNLHTWATAVAPVDASQTRTACLICSNSSPLSCLVSPASFSSFPVSGRARARALGRTNSDASAGDGHISYTVFKTMSLSGRNRRSKDRNTASSEEEEPVRVMTCWRPAGFVILAAFPAATHPTCIACSTWSIPGVVASILMLLSELLLFFIFVSLTLPSAKTVDPRPQADAAAATPS